MCVDFQYAEKLASGLLDKDKANRRRAIRVLIAGIAAIPFVTLFNVFAPIELVLLFLLSLIIISEVLISQQILDYLIGGDSIFPWLYKEYHLSTTEHHTDSSKSNTFEPNASKTKEVILKKRTTIELVICSIIILSFPLRYYQGKHVGIEDAKRELPTTVWHTYSFYTPPEELPIKNMPIKRHTVGFYVQGYVAGHNKIVREWVQNSSSQHRTNL